MKRSLIAILALAVLLTSCSKQAAVIIYEAIVTVKGNSSTCYLQLDDNTVLNPTNIESNPYSGARTRARVYYQDNGEASQSGGTTKRSVTVLQLDSILTKAPVPNLGEERNDEEYGTAPLDIYSSYYTTVVDGFVTLHFSGMIGSLTTQIKHSFNLVRDVDSDDPLCFEFRHDYNEDILAPQGYESSGIVAFDISEILASLDASSYDITIRYTSLESGAEKSLEFHYTPGITATPTSNN